MFRGVILRRKKIVLEHLEDVAGRWVLDVGCGSGRYSIELALRGAAVLGIDISHNMLSMARLYAMKSGVYERCLFVQGDFSSVELKQSFDYCIAIGFFEYISQPVSLMKKMVGLTSQTAFVTLPKRLNFRNILRMLRYRLMKLPEIKFYSMRSAKSLMSLACASEVEYQIIDLGRDFLLILEKKD
jgi:2-polyprenyl-3-methyl-5-hydroxy-6-metoxy-1,4-benzoquinol methylase